VQRLLSSIFILAVLNSCSSPRKAEVVSRVKLDDSSSASVSGRGVDLLASSPWCGVINDTTNEWLSKPLSINKSSPAGALEDDLAPVFVHSFSVNHGSAPSLGIKGRALEALVFGKVHLQHNSEGFSASIYHSADNNHFSLLQYIEFGELPFTLIFKPGNFRLVCR
jgi:hypothetical protein